MKEDEEQIMTFDDHQYDDEDGSEGLSYIEKGEY